MHKYLLSLFAVLLFVAGCASSPVGPGSGVAQAVVKGTPSDVEHRAEKVLQQMNVQLTGKASKDEGKERELTGKIGGTDVRVTIETAPNSTSNVKVKAAENAISGNKDLAQEIVRRIVQQG